MPNRNKFGAVRLASMCLGIVAVFSTVHAGSLGESIDLARYSVDKDIPYGPDPKQVFDLYISRRPDGPERPAVTIVLSHGGGFYLSDKSEEEQYIEPFLERGFDVVNANYRLGQGIFAAMTNLASLLRHLEKERNTSGFASDRWVSLRSSIFPARHKTSRKFNRLS